MWKLVISGFLHSWLHKAFLACRTYLASLLTILILELSNCGFNNTQN